MFAVILARYSHVDVTYDYTGFDNDVCKCISNLFKIKQNNSKPKRMTINLYRKISQYFKPYIYYSFKASHICRNHSEIHAEGCDI